MIHIEASETLESVIVEDIECMAQQVPGVKRVTVHVVPATLFDGQT